MISDACPGGFWRLSEGPPKSHRRSACGLTPATTQRGRGTRRPRADQHFQQSPVGRKAQVAAGSLTAASRGLTPATTRARSAGTVRMPANPAVHPAHGGTSWPEGGGDRSVPRVHSHRVVGGEAQTIRPPPAHLEGDKRSTGDGLQGRTDDQTVGSGTGPVGSLVAGYPPQR